MSIKGERMNLASNSVLGETPKFVFLRLLPANTADKINFFFAPATRAEGFMGSSNCIASSHGIAEVIADRVSKAKAYRDYI